MKSLPIGTVTFLFTDIEGSTALLQHLKDAYPDVLMECRRLVRAAVEERSGQEFGAEGDAIFAAFPSARDGLMAAITAQQRILRHPWPSGATVRVRMGLHTGEARVAEGEYVGIDVHRAARICSAGHGGQVLLSDTVSALVTKDLPDGVGLRDLGEHRLKDLAHAHRLFQVLALDLPPGFPPLRSLDARPNNLPIQLTSFIGREKEIAEVKRLLGTARLVTLTGSGGAGKTRLALQVAAEAVDDHRDGVWLAEFAPIGDPALIPKTVASALNVLEQPGRTMVETLVDALRHKALLLVLDNCEHLVAACAHFADALLRVCPNARILATSREALGVTGETTWRVPSLSVPDPWNLPRLDRFTEYEAVRLFIDRAVASESRFAVTISNAQAVAQVCHRLDGIPLAIELAAARIKVLAVEQIAARLDDRFRLLTGGSRTAVPRQQTLRAAMDWSYDLLYPKERAVLRQLSVFAGGWTLETAEAVCAAKDIGQDEILDLLTQLVHKSLVSAEMVGGAMWYRMPETIRQYAWDLLVASKETDDVRTRHRAWYLSLAERAEPRLHGSEDTKWLSWLEVEHDNLRAALGWSSRGDEGAEIRLRLVAALWEFWNARTHWDEGSKWMETALAQTRSSKLIARVRALYGGGRLAIRRGNYERAMALYEQSRALAQELGDRVGVAMALEGCGLATLQQEDFDAATALFEKSLALSRELEDMGLMATALSLLSIVARSKGDYAKAVGLSEESLAMARTMGAKRAIAHGLRSTGHTLRLQGDLERATGLYRESLTMFAETGDKWIATECIEGLALIASVQGYAARATRLFGAAEAARKIFGITMPRSEAGNQEHFWAAVRDRPEETPFGAAWAEGRAMTLEQAIEYALAGATD